MTIKELYEWSIEHNCEDYDLYVNDEDGCRTYNLDIVIDENSESVGL